TPGDSLPYVPQLQGSVGLTLTRGPAEVSVTATYLGEMLDEAAPWDDPAVLRTDNAVIVDAGVRVSLADTTVLYLRTDNVFDTSYIASFRPFGARPGRPLQIRAGLRHQF
ncbi:MAG: TonB-dependent receptor, partial [Myxococcota bacterium]